MAEKPAKPKRKKRTRRNRDARPYQRKSDGQWIAVGYYPSGKRKPCYGATAEDAEEKRKKFYTEIEALQPITVGRTDTVEKYLTGAWLTITLPQRVQAGKLSQSTADSYRHMVEAHIVPHVGRVKLVEFNTTHVRAWLLELAKKPSAHTRRKLREGETKLPPPETISTRTQQYAFAVLRRSLNDAVNDEIIKRNPLKFVDSPTAEKKEARPLTKDEAQKLLGAAAGTRLWAYWLIVLALGLRRGEGLGLRWEDVDLDEGTVTLRQSIQRLRGDKDPETGRRKGKLVRAGLKTEASKATMKLPTFACEALKEHKTAQAAEQLAARMWVDKGIVFASTVGTELEPRNVSRMWADICDKAEVDRCRIHDLRHAAGSFLFADGVDLRVIQGMLRHTRLATTSEIYVHLLEETKDAATASMEGLLVDLAGKRREKTG
jgi:integrase